MLEKKLQKVKELCDLITLHQGQKLSFEQKAKIDEEEVRLTYRLEELLKENEKESSELVEKFKIKEADEKIKSMEKILKLIK